MHVCKQTIFFCVRLRDDFVEAMDGVMSHLRRESHPSKLVYIGELLHGQTFSPKMVWICFVVGDHGDTTKGISFADAFHCPLIFSKNLPCCFKGSFGVFSAWHFDVRSSQWLG